MDSKNKTTEEVDEGIQDLLDSMIDDFADLDSFQDEEDLSDTPHFVLPLRDIVLFPGMIAPLFVGRQKSGAAIEAVSEKHAPLLAITQKDPVVDSPTGSDLYGVGTLCNVLQVIRLPDGSYKILLEGIVRHSIIRIDDGAGDEIPLMATSFPMPDIYRPSRRTEAAVRYVSDLFEGYAKLNKKIPRENLMSVLHLENPGMLTDQMAAHMNVKVEVKQRLLSEPNVEERLNLLSTHLERENEILEMEKKIRGEVRGQIDKSQRDYYISEQIKALQRELGREGEGIDEIEEYKEKIEKSNLPEEVAQRVEKEINRLSTMPMMSPEATVVRTYLDWLLDLPWSKSTEERLNLPVAEKILEGDHFGLKKPKERILEHLAVRKLNPDSKGPILCFVGPPGVGKTSLGRSIARATNREFARISLGGMRDEAEIRGHRRTYIGSLPGRIIQSIRKVGVNNPVLLLDEVDKMSTDFRGDPASALLEVLDPEQNKHFTDNYLEVEFDLSRIFFVTTANILHPVAPALQDRMEVIEISSYTEPEKVQIAKRYLVPRAIQESGLNRKQISFHIPGIQEIIRSYTREAGVRNLEREIQSVCRKVARRVTVAEEEEPTKVVINRGMAVDLLGYSSEETDAYAGIAQVWRTEVGGALKSKFWRGKATSPVMAKSCKNPAARHRNGIPDFHRRYDIHIHLRERSRGRTLSGVTLATALISLGFPSARNDRRNHITWKSPTGGGCQREDLHSRGGEKERPRGRWKSLPISTGMDEVSRPATLAQSRRDN